jgi:hypothetical protein
MNPIPTPRPAPALFPNALALAWLLAAATGVGSAPPRVFVERFTDPAGAKRWGVSEGRPAALSWSVDPDRPGWRVEAFGAGHASAPWGVGTEPFELTCDVELDLGEVADWRYPGICVAVTSARPEDMGPRDVAFAWTLHVEGPSASVRQGGLWKSVGDKFVDKDLTKRGELNRGGEGGHFASLSWPNRLFDGTRLTLRIERTPRGAARFTVYNADANEGREPWWQGACPVPRAAAGVPLTHVVVMKVLNANEYRSPPAKVVSYHKLSGWVRNIQGRRGDGPPAPRLDRYTTKDGAPVLRGGAAVDLLGAGLAPGSEVTVGGRSAAVLSAAGDLLTARLPELPEGHWYPVSVRHPGGLVADLPGGVGYGRLLRSAEPGEVLPAGGDEVTVVGAGFGPDTKFFVGGAPAEVVKLTGGTRAVLRAPAGKPGRAKVTATSGAGDFAGEVSLGYAPHPYLLFDASGLAGLRKKFDEPMFADYKAAILANGAASASARLPAPDDPVAWMPPVQDTLWARLLGGDRASGDRLGQLLDRVSGQPGQDGFALLTVAAVAVAYDATFAEMPPARRERVRRYLERAVRTFRAAADARAWDVADNPSNTVPVMNAGGALAALAVRHSLPGADDLARQAGTRVHTLYHLSPDGGCVEGSLYWNFALSYYLMLGHALRHTLGDDQGLLDRPELRKNYRFVEATLAGDGTLFPFNDSQPWLTGASVCADLGSRFDQPLLRWAADRVAALAARGDVHAAEEVRRGDCLPYAFLWRDRVPAKFPGVPTAARLEAMQWGVLRSDGTLTPALCLGVAGRGGRLTHHHQADAGSFVLYAGGEMFLIDPGYYQPKAEAHSLPLIDGKGPTDTPGTRAPVVDFGEKGPVRWLAVDLSKAYAGGRPARRVFALLGDRGAVVLDDIGAGRVTAQYQCGFAAEPAADGRGAAVAGKGGKLLLRLYGPDARLRTEGPKDFGKSWVYKLLADKGLGSWHRLTADYAADPARPLVTVLWPAPAAGKGPAAPEVRHERGGVTVSFPGGPSARFSRGEHGWELVRP